MPVFDLSSLVRLLSEQGYRCKAGSMADVMPERRPYFERWLANRDGFVTMQSGNIDYIGIEEVVRMGPFFDVHCMVANDFVADNDDNAHNLLDASPYYKLKNGKATNLGWSGGVLSTYLAKDAGLTQALSQSITREEVKRLKVKAHDYCCIIETGVWDPAGLAAVFPIIDMMATHTRQLLKQVHFGEYVDR
ncbi:MAG: hypothetical protein QXJ74_00360 [Nitrososphaera sp.]|uniref:hypothetical protein n=1 Tax=Nitrososphaera sp. TaxID=1971748 RepID=UPI00317AA068